MPSEKEFITNEVRENSVANALGDVTSRSSRSNRVEESRVEEETKACENANDAASQASPAAPASFPETHQGCIDLWFDLHRLKFEGEEFSNGGYLAGIVSKRSKQGYGEVQQRIRNWWASTYQRIVDLRFAPSEFNRKWSELKNGPLVNYEKKSSQRRPAHGEDFRKPHPDRDSGFGQPDN